jgi:trigger factor
VKTTITPLEDTKVKLTVELAPEQVREALEEHYKELAQTVQVPGFRQGKVPRDVIERRLGPDTIIHQVIQDLVPKAYPQAVDEAGIRPVDVPEVQVDEYKDGEPLVFHATIPVEPEAKLEGYVGIPITIPPSEVTDEEVESQIDLLRDKFAKLEVIEDRPTQEADFVLTDFTGYLDDEAFEGGAGSDFLLEIGSGRFLPGFEDAMIGMEKGEAKEIWIDVPEDYHGQVIAGKRVRFEVTAKEIKTRQRPEPTDEFAAEASEHDTIEELRGAVRAQIEAAKLKAVSVRGQSQVLDWLQENAEVDVPVKMIDSKHEDLLHEFLAMIQSQGMTIEEYFNVTGQDPDTLRANMETEAEKRVREELALDAVARAEGIEASDMELHEEIESNAKRMHEEPSEVRRRLEERGRVGDVRRSVTRRKTLEWISERADATIKEPDSIEDGPAAESEELAEQAVREAATEPAEVERSEASADTVEETAEQAPDEGASKEE